MKIKIVKVMHHRNGSGLGDSFHVVRFDEGRGKSKSRKVGILFRDERKVAVLDVDLLAKDVLEYGENAWDGMDYADDLRDAVAVFETARAGVLPVTDHIFNGTGDYCWYPHYVGDRLAEHCGLTRAAHPGVA